MIYEKRKFSTERNGINRAFTRNYHGMAATVSPLRSRFIRVLREEVRAHTPLIADRHWLRIYRST